MRKWVKIGLNCYHHYYVYDPKKDESYFDDFNVYVWKVSKRAVLLRLERIFEDWVEEFWIPFRVAKLKKEGNCWFLYIDVEKYKEWFWQRENKNKLLTPSYLAVLFGEEEFNYKPIEYKEDSKTEDEKGEIDEYLIELGIIDPNEKKENEKPHWVEELEKLIQSLSGV